MFPVTNLKAEDLVSLHVSVYSHIPWKAEDLVSLHVGVSSHKPRKAEDLVSLHVSVSSHKPECLGFSLITRKCFQSQTTEG